MYSSLYFVIETSHRLGALGSGGLDAATGNSAKEATHVPKAAPTKRAFYRDLLATSRQGAFWRSNIALFFIRKIKK
jgi:hypothetical protein